MLSATVTVGMARSGKTLRRDSVNGQHSAGSEVDAEAERDIAQLNSRASISFEHSITQAANSQIEQTHNATAIERLICERMKIIGRSICQAICKNLVRLKCLACIRCLEFAL
jgi:hypothetical protein